LALCWHPCPPVAKPKERTLSKPAETPCDRCLPRRTSSPNGRRNHLGTPSEITPDSRATSPRNPHHAFDFEKLVDWQPEDRELNHIWRESHIVEPRVSLGSSFEHRRNTETARLRDGLLDGEIFYTLGEAQIVMRADRRYCNIPSGRMLM